MKNKSWHVYLVKCSDGSLYCGATNNLKERLKTHNLGCGAKYTQGRRPVVLVFSRRFRTKPAAFREEARIKKLPRSQKLKLINYPSTAFNKFRS